MKWSISHAIDGALAASVTRFGQNRHTKSAATPTMPKDAVLVGQTLSETPYESPEPVYLTRQERNRHIYSIGATGSGKTNLALNLIQSDIDAGRTFCVIDLRGDLIERVLLRLAHSGVDGQKVCLIDLRNDGVVGFNPLQGPGDVYARALHVLGVLKRQSDSWGIQIDETLRNCLLALAESGWSILEIEPLLVNSAFRLNALSKVSDPCVRSFFTRYEALSAEQRTTWTLAVLNKVTPLLSVPQLRRTFGSLTTLNLSRLLDTPGQAILVSLASDRFHQASRLAGGLIVAGIENAVMARASIPEARRHPVTLYIDEFETMASSSFESIVAEGRRFGLSLALSHQNLTQLQPNLRQALRNNVHVQFYFQTGAPDAAELAAEVSMDELRESVKAALTGQKVGEAFLVRRGQPSIRIQTPYCPDPDATQESVLTLREASQSAYARPSCEVDRDFESRTANFAATNPKPEVRHDKAPKPKS